MIDQPATPPVAAVADPASDPLTVLDVTVDKTDQNAVVAREQALIDARRLAFQKLAERNLSAEDLKELKTPDDKTLSLLVRDFEIKKEQASANRYVANLTVRFSEGVQEFIALKNAPATVEETSGEIAFSDEPVKEEILPLPPVPAGPRNILVLPYFETMSGKTRLWDDPNPWREAWQAAGNLRLDQDITLVVPVGDIRDVSSGSPEGVWSGDFALLERLLGNYGATEIVLAVANKSTVSMLVDWYIYRGGRMERQRPLMPYMNSKDDAATYREAIGELSRAIQTPAATTVEKPRVEDIAKEVSEAISSPKTPENDWIPEPPKVTSSEVPVKPAPDNVSPFPAVVPEAAQKVTVDAAMSFTAFPQWLEVQKRLAAISPPPVVEISSLTKNAAHFKVHYDGPMEKLKQALAQKGMMLNLPPVEVDTSVVEPDKPAPSTVYDLRMAN